MYPRPRSRNSRGFTLVELIVTIAILGIVASIAVPSFREIIVRMNTTDNTNQLVGALNLARAEAVKRGRAAGVIANGGDWNQGWQVLVAAESASGIAADPVSPGGTSAACAGYLDNGLDGASTVPLCPQHRGPLEGGYTLRGAGTGAGASNVAVVFSPTGALRGATAFDFSVCRPSAQANAAESRRIRVAASGTIESRRDTTGAPAGACN